MYIYTLYIQPTAPIETYRQYIEAIQLLVARSKVKDSVVVLGDFNLEKSTVWHENDSGFDYIPTVDEFQSIKAITARELTSTIVGFSRYQIFKTSAVTYLIWFISTRPNWLS